MSEDVQDVGTVLPEDHRVTLENGTVILIEQLKTRQFFRLLRIITHGAGPGIMEIRLDPEEGADAFMQKLLQIVLLSIPDAEQETIDFLLSMCKPVGLVEHRALSKADKERNRQLVDDLTMELYNPDPIDFVSIIEAIIKRESKDIQALGKKLTGMFNLAEKTGQIPTPASTSPTTPEQTSSEGSAEPLTQSPPNTVGLTNTSLESPSVVSVNAPLLSSSVAG